MSHLNLMSNVFFQRWLARTVAPSCGKVRAFALEGTRLVDLFSLLRTKNPMSSCTLTNGNSAGE